MTAVEFERDYAARSGVSVEQLHAWGRYAERCYPDCDSSGCCGWRLGHPGEDAIFENALRDARAAQSPS